MSSSIMGDPLVVFGSIAALMFLGFLGNLVFARLRFNDTLILIGVGVFLGPVTGSIPADSFEGVRALVGPLALILILFDGGLALKFHDLRHGLMSATAMAVLGFTITAAAVGAATAGLLDIPFTTGLILGAILGGTSALVVLPSLQHMKTEKKTATTLNLESALTDVLVVVVAFTLISIVALGVGLDTQDVASKIVITFAMSIIIGAGAAFLWLWIVPAVRDRPYGYMLTLGVMFALYVCVEWILQDVSSGGGPLAVLAFGVMLGNTDRLSSLGARAGEQFTAGMRRFQGEIAFLVRTFFFVYLGILVDPAQLEDVGTWALAIVLLGIMVITRYVAVAVTRRELRLSGDSLIIWVMMPRGLAAAVLAAVPAGAPYFIPGTERFVSLAFLILVLTNVMSSVGAFAIERFQESDPGKRLARAAKREQKRDARKAARAKAKADARTDQLAKAMAKKTDAKAKGKKTKKQVELEFEDAKPRKHPRRKDTSKKK